LQRFLADTKYGKINSIQPYKWASYRKRFFDRNRINSNLIWEEYLKGKQTYLQLAAKYNCSTKTIHRKIDSVNVDRQTTFISVVNVLMDTTYFGKKFEIMVFKDSLTGQILFKQYVKQETDKLYFSGIEEIDRRGIKIQAITCDGRKGLLQLFEGIPIQMCNFHQVAIIRRCLTKSLRCMPVKSHGNMFYFGNGGAKKNVMPVF
jgi:hypothetical protein